jgi:hypothetical protein
MRLIHKPALFGITRELVAGILRKPFAGDREWTVQGIGMARTNLDRAGLYRLNVWHQDLVIPNISSIHTHPWDLKSYVINGRISNQRYDTEAQYDRGIFLAGPVNTPPNDSVTYMPVHGVVLGCGTHPNGEWLHDQFDGVLYPKALEHYDTGQVYEQGRDEIHRSIAATGTVTLNVRTNKRDDGSATVYWPRGQNWVDAKQRAATPDEVYMATGFAMCRWEGWPT